ncbi:NAD(P)-dependent oxidoreductase [Marinobacter sp. 71-i]|uniref:NAD(P)-dependent oxidoreductase n=1 Tax=Marinobacter iranensis TaxID=2962607 RepID=A0ABT5Y7G2_9GAMM|nr:NAD(P)-dependent oxidoreductase [Marinobacter iranensis]MDF0749573.1 NAD(P)-dependent oxidoreductase [Marinobacter iranensis]
MSLPKLGFIGIGRMGMPMARRLIQAGYSVVVFDPNAEAVKSLVKEGATGAENPAEVATNSEVILLSLPTPDIVDAVAFGENGIVYGVDSDTQKTVIDLSTTGPEGARALAEGLSSKGIKSIDCPVSGGVGGAEKGTLALMASGDPSVVENVGDVLKVLGNSFLVGPEPGMGQMIKVINNLVSVTALAITSEALVLGTKAGLNPDVMVDVFNASSGQSNASLTKIPKFVLTRSFDFGFALDLSVKDARLCLEQSEALGVPMVVGSAVREMLKITKAKLGPQADMTSIIQPVEEWAGIKVRGANAKPENS